MKNISKYLGAGLLLFTAACSQTQEGDQYTPNKDDAKAIHFIQSSIQKEFPQDAVQGVINVEIARPGNKGAYKVYLATKDDDYELFSVPAEATIPDGSHSVTVPVEVDLSNFVMGSNYKTTLYISSREARPGDNAAQVAQYSDKVTLSATYELEWETLYRTTGEGEEIPQLATYHYNGYYSGRDSGLEVEKAVGANIFRLKDWASGVTFKFVLHDDNTCTVPAQSIGYYNSNYNEYVYVADMAVYTGNDSAYASYPCTFDGESTFSFYLIYYVSSGYFAQGTEKLVFDTDIDTTPVVEIAFEGIETTSTGFKAPKLHFSPNEYTKYYKAAVVAGDITADAERQQEVRRQLIDDKLEAVTPVVTLLADDASVWNVPSGNYTAVALAYDSIENPCKLYTQRFTNDPNDEYAPRSLEFEFYAPENNLNYSPYNTLIWQMQTANVAAMKYLCVKTAVADYLCEALGMTLEEVTASRGYDVPEEMIAQLNSPEGRGTSFSPLDEGSTYTLALLMYNSFGDTAFVSKSASTFGYFAKDFDRTKTLEDFIGAFGVTATVDVDSQSSEKTFRMDIARINDRDVLISGMTDMRDFAPQLKGYYDKELHMLIVEPQYAGMYNGAYATLGFSNGLSIFWGDAGMAVGYIGDTLYWASSPYSPEEVNSYMFLLFSTPQASSSSYLRQYAGSKTYSSLKMKPLQQASAQTAAPLGAGPQVRHHRLRPGREAHRRGIPRLQGQGRTVAARADQLLPRLQHGGRLPRSGAARDGQRGFGLRHGTAPRQGGADVPRHGRQLLPRSHGRGSRDEHLPRRDPRKGGFSGEDDRLHPVLPPRGRVVRQGRARTQPPAPVRQGGDRAALAARKELRGIGRHGGPRGEHRQGPGPALPHPAPVRRRHVVHLGADLRFRSLLRGPETLARSVVGIEFRVVPGQPPQTPLPRRGEENPAGAHPQRLVAGPAAHRGRAAGELSDPRRHPHPRGADSLHGF